MIALPTAKPALTGPDAAVNGIHFNRIQAIDNPRERAAFIAEKQTEYAAGIGVFKIANENAVEDVVPANELRRELINRLSTYRRRDRTAPKRRRGVVPV